MNLPSRAHSHFCNLIQGYRQEERSILWAIVAWSWKL